MGKQKAIELVRLAPWGWEYFAKSNGKFYKNQLNTWFFFVDFEWSKCEELTPLYSTRASMIPKSEILKIAEELKNAGDNLVLGCEDGIDNLCDRVAESILKKNPTRSGCEDSKCNEWLRVGSIVTWGNKSVKGEVKALSDGLAWIKNEYGNYCSEYVSSLQKPKTPEEDLRDDIVWLTIKHMENKSYPIESNAYYLFSDLIRKYKIKPQ